MSKNNSKEKQTPLVSLIMGSDSDRPVAEKAIKVLQRHDIPYEVKVLSAHRNPEQLEKYIQKTSSKVFIAIAGLAAALPGVIASKTNKPVIGVPVDVKLNGLDALLSIVQMPPGVPVATVGIDRGDNAAHLALQILGLIDKDIKSSLS